MPQVDGTFNKNNTHPNGGAGLFTDYQPLAIHPLSGPAKTPQKTALLAGKTAFSQNYFSFRLFTSPTPASIPPLFYKVFMAFLALSFATKPALKGSLTYISNYASVFNVQKEGRAILRTAGSPRSTPVHRLVPRHVRRLVRRSFPVLRSFLVLRSVSEGGSEGGNEGGSFGEDGR
jgi:hypothetical protein